MPEQASATSKVTFAKAVISKWMLPDAVSVVASRVGAKPAHGSFRIWKRASL